MGAVDGTWKQWRCVERLRSGCAVLGVASAGFLTLRCAVLMLQPARDRFSAVTSFFPFCP